MTIILKMSNGLPQWKEIFSHDQENLTSSKCPTDFCLIKITKIRILFKPVTSHNNLIIT